MRLIRAAAVQFQHVPHDKAANLAIIRRFVEDAARKKVQVLCFPECCITGYWTLRKLSRAEFAALAEPVPEGPSSQELMRLAKRHDMTIGAGLIEVGKDGKFYKPFVVAMPDGRFAVHRKLHPFVSEFLTPGSDYTVFDDPHGSRIGVLICYDNNIIENVRITALMGADILLAPHQTGGCRSKSAHAMSVVDRAAWDNRAKDPERIRAEFCGPKGREWIMRWLPARAHDNGMFLVFSNGVGPDDDEVRTGNSMILDPYGRVLVETCKAGEDMVVADLDPALLENCTGRRWIRTRRPELYKPLVVPTGREIDTRTSRMGGKGI